MIYNYTISSDTANGIAESYSLESEIKKSSILIAIDYITVSGDSLDIAFKAALSTEDKATLDSLVLAHTGVKIIEPESVVLSEKRSVVTNRLEFQVMKPEGSSTTKVSYDWCDKTTWYQGSLQITDEVMVNSGDGLTYNSANEGWIDLTHGKLYGEDALDDQKEPVIYDNGVEVNSGFTIDYKTGDVVFDLSPTGPVTCDYWYAQGSTWSLVPDPGKTLFIEHAELNFSKDIDMTNPVVFEIWVYNPSDLPNKVPYQSIKYKNIKDIINSANLGQGYIPAVGGLQNDVLVFPFNYATVKPLSSSYGAELRISLENDQELGGEWSTATFYVLSEDEV